MGQSRTLSGQVHVQVKVRLTERRRNNGAAVAICERSKGDKGRDLCRCQGKSVPRLEVLTITLMALILSLKNILASELYYLTAVGNRKKELMTMHSYEMIVTMKKTIFGGRREGKGQQEIPEGG